MAKGYKSGKKAISAGDGEYRLPVKKVVKTPEQKVKHAQQIKDAKKRQTERFKQMKEDNPELLRMRSMDAKRKANKRAETKAFFDTNESFFQSRFQQAAYNIGYDCAMKDFSAREDAINAKEAA